MNLSNLNEIVFENRNKEFGAYQLRRTQNKVMMLSVGSVATLVLILFCVKLYIDSGFTSEVPLDSQMGQVMTPEMSIVTVNLPEPILKEEKPSSSSKSVSSSPPPIPKDEIISNDQISKFEPKEDSDLQPPLEDPKEEISQVQETSKNIDLFEEQTKLDSISVSKKTTSSVKSGIVLKTKKEIQEFETIKRRVKKVYPYVVMADIKLKELELKIASIPKNRDVKKLTKQYEEELKNEFGKEISALSFQEGQVLMKLLNRNTSKTAYDLVKQFRGTFQAMCAQGLAKMFGQNLKTQFIQNEDIMIETAVAMVERGEL